MGKKKPSKAKKRVRALKQAEPTALLADETDWAQFEPEDLKNAPHTFIIYRGKVGRYMKELMKDLRKVMEPFTASNLKMKKGNVLKDYVSIASYFHVSHLCILTRTILSPYFKICKIARGPTLTFRILNYTLARDVLSSLRKQVTFEAQFLHQPLLIMNNFSQESQTQDLIQKSFQNMFPSINVTKVRLAEIRRVLLLNYIEEDDSIEFRHYAITFKTTGVSKAMKKVLISKNGKIPNLGRCADIADFINREGDISESEAEDNTETVGVSHKMGVKVSKGLEEVGIKLVELGPRLKMQLIKVEEGLCEGEVLYHKIVEKTAEEKLFVRQQRNLKKKLKIARKTEQKKNVERKKKEKEEHKQKCLQGMGMPVQQDDEGNPDDDEQEDQDDNESFQNRGKFQRGKPFGGPKGENRNFKSFDGPRRENRNFKSFDGPRRENRNFGGRSNDRSVGFQGKRNFSNGKPFDRDQGQNRNFRRSGGENSGRRMGYQGKREFSNGNSRDGQRRGFKKFDGNSNDQRGGRKFQNKGNFGNSKPFDRQKGNFKRKQPQSRQNGPMNYGKRRKMDR